jgi:hypothetical protein
MGFDENKSKLFHAIGLMGTLDEGTKWNNRIGQES